MILTWMSVALAASGDSLSTAGQECAANVLNRDAWFEAAGEVITLPFRDLAEEGLVFVTDQYQDDYGALFTDGDDFITIDSTSYPNDGVGLNGFEDTITVEFDPPIYWAAVDLPACDPLILFSGGRQILEADNCSDGFVGAGSTIPIDKVVIVDSPSCPCIDDLHFSRTPITIDCNLNGIPDLIEIRPACSISPDCNGNLVPDDCDIASRVSHDCDGNGIPDECEVAQWQALSDQHAPFGAPGVPTLIFSGVPLAGSDVQVRIRVSADLDEPLEFISWVKLDDYLAGELLFMDDGLHCADPFQEAVLTVSTEQYNSLVEDDGLVEVRVKPSSAVDLEECPGSFVEVELAYFSFSEQDLDFNGIPDVCETLPGDFDSDGDVDFTDLLTLLSAWGDCPSGEACPEDLDMSGAVGFVDLVLLLSNWT